MECLKLGFVLETRVLQLRHYEPYVVRVISTGGLRNGAERGKGGNLGSPPFGDPNRRIKLFKKN